jgi:hypothetical protein
MGVHYRLVVEQQQYDDYLKFFPAEKLIILDKKYQDEYDTCDDLGDTKSKGPGPARNFIWEHSIAEGHDWHWVMDDNIEMFLRLHNNQRIPVADGTIFHAMEEFVLRYQNIAMAGPQYFMFAPSRAKLPPFTVGTRIYSCNLIRNDLPYRWRGRYNEDTDLSLQMLKDGWNTVQFNAFLQLKVRTQTLGGGNTEAFYAEEGTLPKSQMLVDMHPDVAKLVWRFSRWHHHVDYSQFKNRKLVKREDYVAPEANPYKMKLVERQSARPPRVLKEKQIVVPEIVKNLDEKVFIDAYEHAVARLTDFTELKYPIYIPTKNRADIASTPRKLEAEGIKFILVVEQEDVENYKKFFPDAEYLVLDKSNQGIAYARNACKADAVKRKAQYHWQVDDDVRGVCISKDAKETNISFTNGIGVMEHLVDSFDNLAAVCFRHMAFSRTEKKDIKFNHIIYSFKLIESDTDIQFRDGTIEDIEHTLQLLDAGKSTVVFNRLLYKTPATGTEKGGNTDHIHTLESREKRAKGTKSYWPGVFKLRETTDGIKIAPSRIWGTFKQRPVPKAGK